MLLCARPGVLSAQTLYLAQESASNYVPLRGGTPLSFANEDDGTALVELPFSFRYYGVSYTHITVAVNGHAFFGGACERSFDCQDPAFCDAAEGVCTRLTSPFDSNGIPSTATPDAVIAPFWDDIRLSMQGGTVRTAVEGQAPERAWVVEWAEVPHFSMSDSRTSFQLRLYEGANNISFHYGPYRSAADDFVWSGVIGIENDDASEGVTIRSCSAPRQRCNFEVLRQLTNRRIDLIQPDGVELAATLSLAAPRAASPGALAVDYDVVNLGQRPATQPFRLGFALSRDEVLDAEDLFLGSAEVIGLTAGTHFLGSTELSVPGGLMPGLYHLAVEVDDTHVVAEDLESNNVAWAPVPIRVGPDIVAQPAEMADFDPAVGAAVNFRIQSLGAPVASVEVALVLSTDGVFDAFDPVLYSADVEVGAATEIAWTASVAAPAGFPPGAYHALTVVDPSNALPEAVESNNVAASTHTVSVLGADVRVDWVDGPDWIFPGESFELSATLSNDGDILADGLWYGFYLSDNRLITVSDPRLGGFGPLSLVPGASVQVRHRLQVPPEFPRGTYFVGVIADERSQVVELDENNNILGRGETVRVRAPAPDFVALDVAPDVRGAAGEDLRIERVLLNQGNAPGQVSYSVGLVRAGLPGAEPNPIVLGSGERSLAPGESDRSVDVFPLPADLPRGSYVGWVEVDPEDAVDELREANNLSYAASEVTVLDAVLRILTTELPAAVVGNPYEVSLAATGATGPLRWRVEGPLPPGLRFSAEDARIVGVPEGAWQGTIRVAVTDGRLQAEASLRLVVAEALVPMVLATRSLLPAYVGRPYEYPLTVYGGVPPYRWLVEGALPGGLALGADGVIEGTPTEATQVLRVFAVEDALGDRAEAALMVRSLGAANAVQLSTDALPPVVRGRAYGTRIGVRAGSGEAPFAFSVTHRDVPAGIELRVCDDDDRWFCVAGEADALGTYEFDLRVVDVRGDVDHNRYWFEVREDLGLRIVSGALPEAEVGTSYRALDGSAVALRAVAEPGFVVRYRVGTGTVPPGLVLGTDGVLHGTPEVAGLYGFLVHAEATPTLSATSTTPILEDRAAVGVYVRPLEARPGPSDSSCECRHRGKNARVPAWLWAVLGFGVLRARRRASKG